MIQLCLSWCARNYVVLLPTLTFSIPEQPDHRAADSRPSRFLEKPPRCKWVTTLEINFDFLMPSAWLLSLSLSISVSLPALTFVPKIIETLTKESVQYRKSNRFLTQFSLFLSFEIDREMMRMWNKRPQLNGFIFGTRSPKWVRAFRVSVVKSHRFIINFTSHCSHSPIIIIISRLVGQKGGNWNIDQLEPASRNQQNKKRKRMSSVYEI